MSVLFPDDNSQSDTEWQKEVREYIKTPPATEDEPPFILREIRAAANRLKNKKAPGIDNLNLEIIKRIVKTIGSRVTSILNNCLSLGMFPKRWKQSVVRVLLKGRNKDPKSVKSYRPICLLPILSKVLERVLTERLDNVFNESEFSSKRQFGFKKRKEH